MKDMTVKISMNDYILLESLRLHVAKKRKIAISKKGMLSYILRKTHQELVKE